MTDKHRVLWLLPTRTLHVAAVKGKDSAKGKGKGLLADLDSARAMWQAGSLHFAMSAPRSVIGKWRMSFVPPVPIEFAGEVLCLTLEWVGNKFFYHECLRRAMHAALPGNIGILGPLFMRDTAPTECLLAGTLSRHALQAYEACRKFVLDDEQRDVLYKINRSTRSVIFIQASAGVGKTSVLDCVVSALISAEPVDVSKLVLILAPNRELRHDICQDLLSCVLQSEQLLWLGRPPPGRNDGLWDDILEDRIKEKQRDVWIRLGLLNNQLADNLKTFREHSLREGNWNFIQDVYLQSPMPDDLRITQYLDALWAAKLALRDFILMEVEQLVKPRDSIIAELGMPVQVAVATADAYAKFLSKNAKSIGAKILKSKQIEVGIFDEAQSYDMDQVLAITAMPGPQDAYLKTILLAGDPHQTVSSTWPRWTRVPWISAEARPMRPAEEHDTDTPELIDAPAPLTIKNPEPDHLFHG
jgi:hypothetical protein